MTIYRSVVTYMESQVVWRSGWYNTWDAAMAALDDTTLDYYRKRYGASNLYVESEQATVTMA